MIAARWEVFGNILSHASPDIDILWSVARDTGREGEFRYELPDGMFSDIPRYRSPGNNHRRKEDAEGFVTMPLLILRRRNRGQ